MQPRVLIIVAALAAAALLPAHAYASVRPVTLTVANATGRVVAFTVNPALLGAFSSLYVSSTPYCTTPYPTWFHVFPTAVLVLFDYGSRPPSSLEVYLCYGSVQYQPVQLLNVTLEGSLEVTLNGVPVSGSSTVYSFITSGGGYTVYLGQYTHVDVFNWTLYIFGTYDYQVLADGSTVASGTVTGSYQYVTVSVTGFDASSVSIELTRTSSYGYADIVSYSYSGVAYVRNSTETNVTLTNVSIVELTVSGYNPLANLSTTSWWAALSTSSVETSSGLVLPASSQATIYLSPWTQSIAAGGSEGAASLPGTGNATLALSGYGYTGSATVYYTVLGGNVSLASAVIGQPLAVAPSSAGNATSVTVSVDSYTPVAVMLMVAAVFFGVEGAESTRLSLAVLAMASAFGSAMMFIRAGDAKVAAAVLAMGGGLSVAAFAWTIYKRYPGL